MGSIWTKWASFGKRAEMKHLSILVLDGESSTSTHACIIGAYQVFATANAFAENRGEAKVFAVNLVGASSTDSDVLGLFTVKPQRLIEDLDKTDLIIIPSALVRSYETATTNNKKLINWVRKQYKQGSEVASLCSGAFFAASAGVLDGKVCSTHWHLADQFRENFPAVKVQSDRLITDENGVYTNGGAYSFLNLLIYLVEKYYGRENAIHCSKIFQIDMDRDHQSPFSVFSGHKKHEDEMVLDAQEYLESNFNEKISIESLAAKYSVTRRSFDRRFTKATGLTPLDYLQRLKIEAAKKAFETTRKTVSEVKYDTGYTDDKAFREVFTRVTGMSPMMYKSKYNKERA